MVAPLSTREKRIATFAYGITALGLVAWWFYLDANPHRLSWFFDPQLNPGTVHIWRVTDRTTAAILIALQIPAIWRDSPLAKIIAWGHFGVQGFGFLVAALSLSRSETTLGFALMLLSAGTALALAVRLTTNSILWGPFQFRMANHADPRIHLKQTTRQIAAMWAIFLVFLPLAIWIFELQFSKTANSTSNAKQLLWPYPQLTFSLATLLFLLAACINLLAGKFFAETADGTPLPAQGANRLVTSGPYAYVRNPMAASGILMGLAIGIILQSVSVCAYAILGGVWWEILVRREEENHLHHEFGQEYEDYRQRVRCWIPRLSPYVPKQKDFSPPDETQ